MKVETKDLKELREMTMEEMEEVSGGSSEKMFIEDLMCKIRGYFS